jgi:hypothetical protein
MAINYDEASVPMSQIEGWYSFVNGIRMYPKNVRLGSQGGMRHKLRKNIKMTPQKWFEKHLWYVLDRGKIRPVKDVYEACEFLGDIEKRRVDLTEINDDCSVSTVFLCLDHNHRLGLPILFETLIQGGPHDGRTWRYSAYQQAKKAHWEIVDALRAGEDPLPSVGEESLIWKMIQDMIDENSAGEEWKEIED